MSENKWLHRTFVEVLEQDSQVMRSLDQLTDQKLIGWLCSRWNELTMRVQAGLVDRLTFARVLPDVEWHKQGLLLYRYAKEGSLRRVVEVSDVKLTKSQRRGYRKLAAALVLKEEVKRPSTPYVSKPPTGSVRPCDLRAAAVKAVEIPTVERTVSVLFYCNGKLLKKSEVPVSEVREKLPVAQQWMLKDRANRSVTVRGKETLTISEACRRLSK